MRGLYQLFNTVHICSLPRRAKARFGISEITDTEQHKLITTLSWHIGSGLLITVLFLFNSYTVKIILRQISPFPKEWEHLFDLFKEYSFPLVLGRCVNLRQRPVYMAHTHTHTHTHTRTHARTHAPTKYFLTSCFWIANRSKSIIVKIEYIYLSFWVSEWLLFNANSAIVQLYHSENKLIVKEMMMRSALY